MLGYLKDQSATTSSLDVTLRFPDNVTLTPNKPISVVITEGHANHSDQVFLRPHYPILEVDGVE